MAALITYFFPFTLEIHHHIRDQCYHIKVQGAKLYCYKKMLGLFSDLLNNH